MRYSFDFSDGEYTITDEHGALLAWCSDVRSANTICNALNEAHDKPFRTQASDSQVLQHLDAAIALCESITGKPTPKKADKVRIVL